jgi:hypothetical protein
MPKLNESQLKMALTAAKDLSAARDARRSWGWHHAQGLMSTRNPPGTGMLRLSGTTPRKRALPIATGSDFAQGSTSPSPFPLKR